MKKNGWRTEVVMEVARKRLNHMSLDISVDLRRGAARVCSSRLLPAFFAFLPNLQVGCTMHEFLVLSYPSMFRGTAGSFVGRALVCQYVMSIRRQSVSPEREPRG